MLGKKLILPLLLLAPLVTASLSVSPCPIVNHNGSVISGTYLPNPATVIISSNGIVPLVDGQDSQCYNYTLPYAFIHVPQVAVGISPLIKVYMTSKVNQATTYSISSNPFNLTASAPFRS